MYKKISDSVSDFAKILNAAATVDQAVKILKSLSPAEKKQIEQAMKAASDSSKEAGIKDRVKKILNKTPGLAKSPKLLKALGVALALAAATQAGPADSTIDQMIDEMVKNDQAAMTMIHNLPDLQKQIDEEAQQISENVDVTPGIAPKKAPASPSKLAPKAPGFSA